MVAVVVQILFTILLIIFGMLPGENENTFQWTNTELHKFEVISEGGVSELMDGRGCAILALELVPKNLIFT